MEAMSLEVMPGICFNSSSVAAMIRFMLPKEVKSLLRLVGPMPGISSRALLIVRFCLLFDGIESPFHERHHVFFEGEIKGEI